MTYGKQLIPGGGLVTASPLIHSGADFPYHQVDPQLYLRHVATYYHFRVTYPPSAATSTSEPSTDGSTTSATLGYVLPSVAEVLRGLPAWHLDDDNRVLTLTEGDNADDRSALIAATCRAMQKTGHFKVLDRWRDELYPVYDSDGELLFDIERAASPLFGVVTYGVHMTAFVRSKSFGEELKIWVPRRARHKQTYGGMLDNTVAGGIASGEEPFESLVREAAEEATLPEQMVRKAAQACGTVTYFYIRDERAGGETRLLQPECQYVYDLELDEDVLPKPGDDEVEEFYLWTVDEVKEALERAEFKPNCALVLLDFFVRHGIRTAENERNYIEIVSRLHRRLEFPVASRAYRR